MDACRPRRAARLTAAGALHALFVALSFALGASVACAQGPVGRLQRIALVSTIAESDLTKVARDQLLAALRELGYVEGTNIVYERRYAGGDRSRLPALVDEVIALRPDVVLAAEDAALAVRERTTSIPIVLIGSIDPVRAGLVHSLARPGTNVTGIAEFTHLLPEKHIDLMRDINPRLARVAMLVDRDTPTCQLSEANAREAAQRIGVQFVPYHVASKESIEQAFEQMQQLRPDLLLPCPTPLMLYFRELMIDRVLSLRIPYSSFIVATARKGVLFSYAEGGAERNRKIASYIHKLLKGANPAELPIEQPAKLDLVINLQTAQALGLAVPPVVLVRADQVIE
jgi:putative tryptophan/tyrosine transport system substrate-binding protein